ncbi:MAG: shikimate kinase [Lachnospiraceae bacterium]|nr:shikimate kinase [Lachnospiraceae bacterium]MDY5742347.1 shikimate kinase [Lachnospiraceae bacterium]
MKEREAQYGLLGGKLGHSFSPRIHAALAGYQYTLYEKTPEELAEFMQNGQFSGLNVTIPYKQAVMPYLREVSPHAAEIGCVNTIVRRADGSLYGENTDYAGLSALLAGIDETVTGKRVLILGDGGASLMTQTYLRHQKAAAVFVASRRATAKRKALPALIRVVSYQEALALSGIELVINTTPVGMEPHTGATPIDLSGFADCRAVIDLIYNPLQTRLLFEAERLGMKTANGLAMLVEQAAAAAALFTGKPILPERTKQVLLDIKAEMTNIILIGMPGCGKSTVGRLLSTKMKRPFLDADLCFAEKFGRAPQDVIVQQGEAAFRRMETELLAKLTREKGIVLATGGGVVTVPENQALLRQNGHIFYIKRDLRDLSTKGRPLSQQTSVEALFRQRRKAYEDWADEIVFNWSSRRTCQIIEKRWKHAYSGN